MGNTETIYAKAIAERLKDVADSLLVTAGKKYNYSDNAMTDATLIFFSILTDKMWDLQQSDDMPFEMRKDMAQKCGEEIRQLIKTYTGLDTFELVKNYKKIQR